MRKLFIILTGTLLLASGCNTTEPTTIANPTATVTTIDCPNPTSKPCNGQLPTQTPPTPVPPPAETQATPKPPAPNNAVLQPDSAFSLAVGQTGHPGSADTTTTLESLSPNSVTIHFGCKNVPSKLFTLKLGDTLNLKPDCITTLTLVGLTETTARFQIILVR